MGRKPKGPKPQRVAEEMKTKRKENIKENEKNEYLIPKHNLQTHPSPHISFFLFFFPQNNLINKID